MAMPLYKGRNAAPAAQGAWAAARSTTPGCASLIEPLLGALEEMHDADVYHRDIAPDNILWCDDNRPVLLDFGAARLVLADRTQTLTAILKPQFAPIEQYAETQSMRQGPWTDSVRAGRHLLLHADRPRAAARDRARDGRRAGAAGAPRAARAARRSCCSVARLGDGRAARRIGRSRWRSSATRWPDGSPFRARRRGAPLPATPAPDPRLREDDPGHDAHGDQRRRRHRPRRPARAAPAPAPARRSARHDDELETPERSVMLPPKSQSPLKAVLLLLVLVARARPAPGRRASSGCRWPVLQTAAAPVADSASAPEAQASGAATTPVAVAASAVEPASAAASQALAAASAAAATFTPVPASERRRRRARAGARGREAGALRRPPSDARKQGAGGADRRAQDAAARPAATAARGRPGDRHAGPGRRQGRAGGGPGGRADRHARVARTNWREVCADQEPAKIAACVKKLCDNDLRYQRYPICKRMRRQEEQQQQRGTSE